jgi:hypothetical protein
MTFEEMIMIAEFDQWCANTITKGEEDYDFFAEDGE